MEQINTLKQEALEQIQQAASLKELNDLRIAFLGKKGSIQALMKEMKNLPKEEKPAFGAMINTLKQEVAEALEQQKSNLEELEMQKQIESEKIDITLPGRQFRSEERRVGKECG